MKTDMLYYHNLAQCAGEEISIIWCIRDVSDLRPDLSEIQCMAVLKSAKENHNKDNGICRLSILFLANKLFPKEAQK